MTELSHMPWLQQAWHPLAARLAASRLPHALLLDGIAGVGKSVLATTLARRLLCVRAQGAALPCGACDGCRQVDAGTHPDQRILTPDPDKRTPVIPVTGVREIVEFLTLSSQYGGNRVAIIDPADTMNIAAANALLKTLEEPSRGCFLILVTARPSRVTPTIRSRCQRFTVRMPDRESANAWLRQHTSNPEAALAAAGGAPLGAAALAANGGAERLSSMFETLRGLRDGSIGVEGAVDSWMRVGAQPFAVALWRTVAALLRSGVAGAPPPAGIVDQRAFAMLVETLDCRWVADYLDEVRVTLTALKQPLNEPIALEGLFAAWVEGAGTRRRQSGHAAPDRSAEGINAG